MKGLPEEVIRRIHGRAQSGHYDKEDELPKKRSRGRPNYFIEAKTVEDNKRERRETKSKQVTSKQATKKRIKEDDFDSDSDTSVGRRKHKLISGPKKMHLRQKYEKKEIQSSNAFLASSDDDDSDEGLWDYFPQATDYLLNHGREIKQKLVQSRSNRMTNEQTEKT